MRMRDGWIVSAMFLFAGAAGADWLVLNDGTRMETDGPWKVKGRLVVFTGVDGGLASLRASEVDLEASELATESATSEAAARVLAEDQAATRASPEPSPRPVLVLTDADVTHVDPDEQEASAAEPAEEQSLTVVSWEQETPEDGNGVMVTGILRNDGPEVASSIKVLVQILDPDGEILGTQEAQLSSSTLNTGELLNFRVLFNEVPGFDTARFDVSNRSFRPIPPPGESLALPTDEDSPSALPVAGQ